MMTPEQMPENQPESSGLSSQGMRAKMNLPPELKKAYERVVQAGLKLMFDPRTREQTMQMMASPGDPVPKIAQGVGAVMVALYQQSNGTMPQDIIIPAAVELVAHVVEVARDAGAEVTDEQMGEAIAATIEFIAQKFGVDLNQAGQPEQMPQQDAGIVGQAMQGGA